MQDFTRLEVWKKAHQLALTLYRLTATFPKSELYGVTNQIRRAVVSIPANIAEGCGRGSDSDFARFMQIAMGSASEIQYLIILVKDLELVREDDFNKLDSDIREIKKMLTSFIQKLRADS